MNKKRKILAMVLLMSIMTGMVSCMQHACPAYAYKTEKNQNNKG